MRCYLGWVFIDDGGKFARRLTLDLHLSGKVAVVTGASKGIGLAVTRALAREGASVAAGARDMSGELAQLAEGSPVRPFAVDLSTARRTRSYASPALRSP